MSESSKPGAAWLSALVLILLAGVGIGLHGIYLNSQVSVLPVRSRWVGLALPFLVFAAAGAIWLVVAWRRQWRLPPLLLSLRILVVVATGGWLTLLLLAHPYRFVKLELAVGILTGCFSLCLPVLARADALRSSRAFSLVEAGLFQFCVILVGLEIALRVVAVLWPHPLLVGPVSSAQQVVHSYRQPPHVLRYGFPTNAVGYYDDELAPRSPDRPLIVAVGDSFSVGVVPHHFHFTTVAERRLGGVDIVNVGFAALGPAEYLWLWRNEIAELEPDLLIVDLFLGNDPIEGMRFEGRRSALRSVFDRRRVLLFLLFDRLVSLRREAARLPRDAQPIARPRGEAAAVAIRGEQDLRDAFPWLEDPLLEQPTLSREGFLQVEAERAAAVLTPHPPEAYRVLFRALTVLREAAGDTPMMVMLIPDEFQVEDDVWNEVRARAGVRAEDRFAPQERLAAWLDSEGLPYVDLLPALRAVPPLSDGRRHVYHLQDTHFNARGNRVAGIALAEALRRHFPHLLKPTPVLQELRRRPVLRRQLVANEGP